MDKNLDKRIILPDLRFPVIFVVVAALGVGLWPEIKAIIDLYWSLVTIFGG